MPHLIIEVSRGSLERQVLTLPIQLDAAGNPADILAPPFALQQTINAPLIAMRMQIIVRNVQLSAVPGSSQCILNLFFNDGSVELLSDNPQSERLLNGSVSIPFSVGFVAANVPSGGQVAQLTADFTNTVAGFSFNADSKTRLSETMGNFIENRAESAIATALTNQFRPLGSRSMGLSLNLTPAVPSEDILTVDALPGLVWLNGETLALSLQYAPEPSPAPFQPVPFLPAAPTAFGLRLSNDGFQRTVRNPAVRKEAHDLLSDRLRDGFVQQAFHARGGVGAPTDQDRADGQKLLDDYLNSTKGQADLANETPAPTGNGKLKKHIANVPDPFSDFDVEIPYLDMWLGTDRIEGSARATGVVNSIGFTANISFRARPVLITSPKLSIEMQDLQIDDPDISIDLPAWLDWAAGIFAGIISGPLIGGIVGFLFSSIISSLTEALIPSDLGSKVPLPDAKPIAGLPAGVDLDTLTVVPDYLQVLGNWYVFINDPRPFWPTVTIVDKVTVKSASLPSRGTAWFDCLGALGTLMDSPQSDLGTPFAYLHFRWESLVTASLTTSGAPLPLKRFPWTIAIGYRSPEMYHLPIISVPAQLLAPGPLTVTSDVWFSEPPLRGNVVKQTFTIQVAQLAEDSYTLGVPPESGCIFIQLETKSIDAEGNGWEHHHSN